MQATHTRPGREGGCCHLTSESGLEPATRRLPWISSVLARQHPAGDPSESSLAEAVCCVDYRMQSRTHTLADEPAHGLLCTHGAI